MKSNSEENVEEVLEWKLDLHSVLYLVVTRSLIELPSHHQETVVLTAKERKGASSGSFGRPPQNDCHWIVKSEVEDGKLNQIFVHKLKASLLVDHSVIIKCKLNCKFTKRNIYGRTSQLA